MKENQSYGWSDYSAERLMDHDVAYVNEFLCWLPNAAMREELCAKLCQLLKARGAMAR